LRLLVNRLRIQDHIKRYPEVLDVPIKRPLFILGLPRTGTTFLHNLLAQDPTSRWLRLWEILYPCPPPHPTTEKTDPRIQETAKQVQKINTIAPQLSTVHHLDPQAPEEGNQLSEHGMVGFFLKQWQQFQVIRNAYKNRNCLLPTAITASSYNCWDGTIRINIGY
jgi:hypothetical protein